MTQQPSNPLQQAAVHLRAGRKDQARAVLVEFVRQNPGSEDGWMLLSLTLTDPKQQADCLQRVLRINPNNTEARNTLSNLTQPAAPLPRAEPTPPPATPPPLETEWKPDRDVPASPMMAPLASTEWDSPEESAPAGLPASRTRQTAAERRRAKERPPEPAWVNQAITIAIIALFVILLAGGGIWGWNFYNARAQATQQAATQQIVVALASVSYPTLPPTWTNTPTPTITPTPTVTPTPTRTPVPTPLPPEPTLASEMDIIQQQVADVRGLPVQGEIQRYVIDKKRVRGTLEELFLNHGGSRDEVADQARVLSALGLIKPTYDLFTNTLNGISDGIGGFYTPWTKQLYVIGEDWTGVERYVYSHEYDHALTDAHFNISGMGVYPVCAGDHQRCDAIRALVEGDATLLMDLWFEQYATPQDYQDIQRFAYRRNDTTLPEQFPPPYAIQNGAFPYREGRGFVEYLYLKGNWAEVNQAYEDLPQSTEHILHPEKYLAAEPVINIAAPSLEDTIGAEWRRLETNSLGEWMTYLLLGYGADLAAQLDAYSAGSAAAGWGGDTYQIYYNDGTGETIMAVHWVWDAQEDADEFLEAMLYYQDQRFRGSKAGRSDGNCWEANRQASCVFTTEAETLWLLAPNQTTLNNVLARYSNFP